VNEQINRSARHMPSTWAQERENGSLAFLAICTCGWRGPDRADEIWADNDRWDHVDGCDQEAGGSWIGSL